MSVNSSGRRNSLTQIRVSACVSVSKLLQILGEQIWLQGDMRKCRSEAEMSLIAITPSGFVNLSNTSVVCVELLLIVISTS